ncbi:MAG TPA: T9SS type A sorting domain-containing protein [Ignavibacteriaceae bacterium]|nr:T9SS type A sorting domain-containing protein [Ignavibacteriaceae bacterium]
MTGTFTTPALGSENAKLQISYDGYIYNIDYIYWDDLCLGQIIPVELTSFIAKGLGDEVVLNWITATETNNQGFEVERAVNTNSDNKDWKKIGFVSGYGTTTEMKLYTYTDTKLNSGKYVYRLKQIDFDGTVKYSQEVNAEVSVPLQYALEQNYPNPFNPNTTIKYSVANEGFVNIAVFNLLGEKVSTLVSENQKAGNYEVNFNASMLPSGVYFYSMEAGDFKSVRKMLLMK